MEHQGVPKHHQQSLLGKQIEKVLGKPVYTKTDEFPENFRKGGGGHFWSKKNRCKICIM